MGEFQFTPERYLELIHEEIPLFDELQERAASATRGIPVDTILELGTGTGETALRVLAEHPSAELKGVDASAEMLERARGVLPAADLRVARLEDPLPSGPFDLVVSALAVHHLDGEAKQDLFRRVAAVLRPGGRFVLADVVVPERAEDAVAPLTPGYDLPDTAADQLDWLREAGFEARLLWEHADLAVLRADRPR